MAEAATAATTATATAETSAATGVVSKQLLGKYRFHLLKLGYVILPAILNWLFSTLESVDVSDLLLAHSLDTC